jgi:heptosyltransferase-2
VKILFITIGAAGDLLIHSPVFKAMKSAFPQSEITVLTATYRSYANSIIQTDTVLNTSPKGGRIDILENNPNVDKIIKVDRGELRKLKGFKKISAELNIIIYIRRKKYDIVISTASNDRFTLWSYYSGAKIRVGQKKQPFGFLLTHRPQVDVEEVGALRYISTLSRAVGVIVDSEKTEYNISEQAKLWAEQYLKNYNVNSNSNLIAIHPGASGKQRIWLPEYFADVADQLQIKYNYRVLLCGSDFDKDIISETVNYMHSKAIEVYDTEGSIDRLAAIIKRCKLCITNDSGARHLAVAVETPSLAILPIRKIGAWKVYDETPNIVVVYDKHLCKACNEGKCMEKLPDGEIYSTYCLRSISVSQVMEKINEMISV